ncbi:MAG: hypothetical protein FWD14_01130 [Treponema sp.]|nr:hypothetical protein [Treponema sp.]
MQIYAIYDTIAQELGPIFEAKNDEVARRQAIYSLGKQNVNPKEFWVYRLGEIIRNDDKFEIRGLSPEKLEVNYETA